MGDENPAMLKTPNTSTGQISIDIFGVNVRPCRTPQETIYDYHMDGRPQFHWERLRQLLLFDGRTTILDYCEHCPLNVYGGLEGCSGKVENLDIFFRALNELTPQSPWAQVPRDGTPVHPHQVQVLHLEFPKLRADLAQRTWPVAVPRQDGQHYYEIRECEEGEEEEPSENQDGGLYQFYAWNGEGPPGLLHFNDGYTLYFSRHGLLVKPSGEDPIPHTFTRLWREGRGLFGLASNGDTVGFQLSFAKLPSWGFESPVGAELTIEAMPADQVFREILDVLEVFGGIAREFETGFLVKL